MRTVCLSGIDDNVLCIRYELRISRAAFPCLHARALISISAFRAYQLRCLGVLHAGTVGWTLSIPWDSRLAIDLHFDLT
jgi:hypothetical protein